MIVALNLRVRTAADSTALAGLSTDSDVLESFCTENDKNVQHMAIK